METREFIAVGIVIALAPDLLSGLTVFVLRCLDYGVLSSRVAQLQALSAKLGLSDVDDLPVIGFRLRFSTQTDDRPSHGLLVRGQGELDGRRLEVRLMAGPFSLDRFGGGRAGLARCVGVLPLSIFYWLVSDELVLRWRGRYYTTVVDIAFPRSLGSGLRVRRTDLPGYGALRLGDDRLDAHYEVLATHSEAARALLLAPPVKLALLSALDAGLRVDFDGRGITAVLPGCAPEANGLLSAVGSLSRLADALAALAEDAGGVSTERLGSGWPPTGEAS